MPAREFLERLLDRFKGIKLCLEPEIGIEFSGKWLGRGEFPCYFGLFSKPPPITFASPDRETGEQQAS